jgi:hypothetical protein
MILLAFRHGLRASEVCDQRWDQVDFNGAVLHVRRVKNGTPSTHPIQGDELRESPSSPFVFVSERGSPYTTAGFGRMIERAAAGAGLEFKAHSHMLRHACGYALANKGHDTRAIQGWLGHRSITSTAVYTARRRTGSRISGGIEDNGRRAEAPLARTNRDAIKDACLARHSEFERPRSSRPTSTPNIVAPDQFRQNAKVTVTLAQPAADKQALAR